MKFAFIIMGDFNLKYDHAAIHQQTAQIIGVTNLAEASIVAKNYLLRELTASNYAVLLEKQELTENKIPIGYVTHLPEQDEIYDLTFAK